MGKPDSVTVFSFPMKSPHGAVTRTKMSARRTARTVEDLCHTLVRTQAIYHCHC